MKGGWIVALALIWVHAVPLAAAPRDDPTKSEITFATGMAAGCIDAQRRLHASQDLAFNGEAVRDYCYCKAGSLTERFRDSEFQARLEAKEAAAMSTVKFIEIACLEGVKAGRRFAPPP